MSPSETTPSVAASPLRGLYADPALVVIDNTYWLYPTTDGEPGWAATSFSAFSSDDLLTWRDHGKILQLGSDVRWAEHNAWAPAVAAHDGRYFFYYTAERGSIGVASASRPEGPFRDLGQPLVAPGDFEGVAIDPSVFQDDDGTWYLLWGNGVAHIVPLGQDMMSFSADDVVSWVPTGFREAVTIHRRQGLYYASWSENDTRDAGYQVRYATSTSIHGPWQDRGVLVGPDPALGYLATGHHSITRVGEDRWVVAYHRFALQDGNGHRREIVFDALTHHPDGSLTVERSPEGFSLPIAS